MGKPGTEVPGDLPKLVVLGDLVKLEEEEAVARMRQGLEMMRSNWKEEKDVTVIAHDNIVDGFGPAVDLISLLTKETEGWGWTVKEQGEMFGAEADHVLVVGCGHLESVSRAKLSLGILFCCNGGVDSINEYIECTNGYRAAIEQGLVEVAIPQVIQHYIHI